MKRLMFEANCVKRLGFRFPQFYASALLNGVQAYATTPLEYLSPNIKFSDSSEFLNRRRIIEAVNYYAAMELECMPEVLNRSDAKYAATIQQWEQAALRFRYSAEGEMDQYKPDGVICFQGYYLEAAVLRELAAERDIPCMAWEYSFLKGYLVWDNLNGVTIGSRLPLSYYHKFIGLAEREAVLARVDAVFANLKTRKSLEHQSPDKMNSLESKLDRPTVLFLGQVYSDASVIFGCNGYADTIEIMESLAAVCKKLNFQLVIKLHPKENGGCNPIGKPYDKLTWRKMNASSSIVSFIDQGDVVCDHTNQMNTYELIKRSKLVVTLNSQAGLEALAMNRPVVVCGKAFYADSGFVETAFQPVDLEAALLRAMNAWSENRHYLACQFFDSFLSKYTSPNDAQSILRACARMNGERR